MSDNDRIILHGDGPAHVAQGHKHNNHHKKHTPRPCGNPPAVPTGVNFTVMATEALTHLRFTGRINWNPVTTDEGGHGEKIDLYDVQARATDSGGTPVDNEGGGARVRAHVKIEPTHFPITAATITSGTTAQFTLKRPHTFQVGETVVVSGMKPTAYNGTWTVAGAGLTSTTFRADIGASPADATHFGDCYENADKFHVITSTLERPKSWYWQARVRAIDKNKCVGDWSAWSTPILPWTGADPTPPVPTYGGVPITFDHFERHHRKQTRLKFTFNEVTNFTYPGTAADNEDEVDQYVVQMAVSSDGVNEDSADYQKKVVHAKDADANTTDFAIFTHVERRYWYRCRVRTIDKYRRKSAFSSWTSWTLPFDTTPPPAPANVAIYSGAHDRIVVEYTKPTILIPTQGTVATTSGFNTITGTGTKFLTELESGALVSIGGVVKRITVTTDTAATADSTWGVTQSGVTCFEQVDNPDCVRTRIQLSTVGNFNTIYKEDEVAHRQHAFKIADADRASGIFYGRIQMLDAMRNRSKWVDATIAGNSIDERTGGAPNPDGVSVDNGTAPVGTIVHHTGKGIPAGWLRCDGSQILRTTYASLFAVLVTSMGTVTVTIASPAVFTQTAHGLAVGDEVYLTTTGALPTGLAVNTPYWVRTVPNANTFTLTLTEGGANDINTSGTQSGTHSLFGAPYAASGFSSTTFTLPDLRNRHIRGVGSLFVLGADEGQTESNRTHVHGVHGSAAHDHGSHNHSLHPATSDYSDTNIDTNLSGTGTFVAKGDAGGAGPHGHRHGFIVGTLTGNAKASGVSGDDTTLSGYAPTNYATGGDINESGSTTRGHVPHPHVAVYTIIKY